MAEERFEPLRMRGELVEAEHLARYEWAARHVAGRAVLDAGCGAGYGSAVLRRGGARSYLGLDVAEDAVFAATERFGDGDAVRFQQADLAALPLEDASVEAVTCFEVIEHVPDQERVLDELRRVLATGGVLLVSSPNRPEYPPGNPFHVRELEAEEFLGLLRARWPTVRPARQHNWLASAVLSDEAFAAAEPAATVEAELRKATGREPGRELYTLAACSDREMPAGGDEVVMTSALEVRRWLAQIAEPAELTEALAAAERELAQLRDATSKRWATAEREIYWFERAGVDVDRWAERPAVREAIRAVRAARAMARRRGGGR